MTTHDVVSDSSKVSWPPAPQGSLPKIPPGAKAPPPTPADAMPVRTLAGRVTPTPTPSGKGVSAKTNEEAPPSD